MTLPGSGLQNGKQSISKQLNNRQLISKQSISKQNENALQDPWTKKSPFPEKMINQITRFLLGFQNSPVVLTGKGMKRMRIDLCN